jgi:hypothetical protein
VAAAEDRPVPADAEDRRVPAVTRGRGSRGSATGSEQV